MSEKDKQRIKVYTKKYNTKPIWKYVWRTKTKWERISEEYGRNIRKKHAWRRQTKKRSMKE